MHKRQNSKTTVLSPRHNKQRHGNAFLNSVTDKLIPYLIGIIVIHQLWLGRWKAYYKWVFLYMVLSGGLTFLVFRRLWREAVFENKNWLYIVACVVSVVWAVLWIGTVVGQVWIENEPHLFVVISFISLGALFFMGISIAVCDIGEKIASLFISRIKTKLDPSKTPRRVKNIIICALTLTLTVVSLFGTSPSVVNVEINLPRLPASGEDFTIVQISDLHIGAVLGLSYLEDVIDTVTKLKPDMIVMTGNIFDYRFSHYYEPQANVFKNLSLSNKPPYGIFFVPGSSEHFGGAIRTWTSIFENLQIIDLRNGYVPIVKNNETLFYMAGTDDWHSRFFFESRTISDVTLLKPHLNLNLPNILLSNSPSFYEDAKSIGIDLHLCGRTLGGQIFPMHLLIYFFHPYFSGLYEEKRSAIYVSQGTGYWGPPMRLGSKGEITRIILKSKERNSKDSKAEL